jgi:hypothetical protein
LAQNTLVSTFTAWSSGWKFDSNLVVQKIPGFYGIKNFSSSWAQKHFILFYPEPAESSLLGSRVRFPDGDGNFSLHHRVQNGSGAHSASYPTGTGDSFPGGKAAGA